MNSQREVRFLNLFLLSTMRRVIAQSPQSEHPQFTIHHWTKHSRKSLIQKSPHFYFAHRQPYMVQWNDPWTKSQKNYIPNAAALHISCLTLDLLLTSLIINFLLWKMGTMGIRQPSLSVLQSQIKWRIKTCLENYNTYAYLRDYCI